MRMSGIGVKAGSQGHFPIIQIQEPEETNSGEEEADMDTTEVNIGWVLDTPMRVSVLSV